jgi:Spy/CpxP family protein refolding chaperone
MFVYMALLFIAGIITGAAVMSRTAANSQSLKVGRSEEIATMIRQRLETGLELTPDQRQKFQPLIQKTADELEASHLDCLKRIVVAVDKMHEQMLPDLTPDQREKFKQLETERRAKLREKYNYPPENMKTASP